MEKRVHSNEFKTMVVELKQSGMTTKGLSDEYDGYFGVTVPVISVK